MAATTAFAAGGWRGGGVRAAPRPHLCAAAAARGGAAVRHARAPPRAAAAPSDDSPPVDVGVNFGVREVAVEGARAAEEAAGDFDVESAEFRPDVPLLNSVVLTGRLGRDPTLRHVGADDQRKVALLTFSLAVTDEVPEGEWEEGAERGTSWFSCEMWGQRAEAASRFLRKGLRVGVDGQLGFSFYKDRGGAEVEAPVLIVRSFEVLQSRSESDGAWSDAASRPAKGYDAVPSRRPAAPPAPAARAAGGEEVEDDGLPF